jgi:ABC-type amino acid transport substrate-binding protein
MTPATTGINTDRLTAIRERGTLRVGYLPDLLPFVFHNADGKIVGLDAEMANQLAFDLGVGLEFVRIDAKGLASYLREGRVDIVMSGMSVTPERATEIQYSEPYMDVTLAFVVRDHERKNFSTWNKILAMETPRIAVLDIPYYINRLKKHLPRAELEIIDSPRGFFEAAQGQSDAMFYTAEAGSGWTLVYPAFSVTLARPNLIKSPLAYALPRDARELRDYIDNWITLKLKSGMVDRLYKHWILGQGAARQEPRWSVIRNVLEWVD